MELVATEMESGHEALEEKLRFGVTTLSTLLMLTGTLLYLYAIVRIG